VAIDYKPSFVDGIGSPSIFADMWEQASKLLDGSLVVTLEQVATSIRLLAERNRVIAEGAGAASVAAALAGIGGVTSDERGALWAANYRPSGPPTANNDGSRGGNVG